MPVTLMELGNNRVSNNNVSAIHHHQVLDLLCHHHQINMDHFKCNY
jgi:hypothetical protein